MSELKKEYSQQLLDFSEYYFFSAKVLKESLIHKNISPNSSKLTHKLKFIPLYFLITQSYELLIKSWIVLNTSIDFSSKEEISEYLVRLMKHSIARLFIYSKKENVHYTRKLDKYKYAIIYSRNYGLPADTMLDYFKKIEEMKYYEFEELLKEIFINLLEDRGDFNETFNFLDKLLKDLKNFDNSNELISEEASISDFLNSFQSIYLDYVYFARDEHPYSDFILKYHTSLFEISEFFIKRIMEEYNSNKYFNNIFNQYIIAFLSIYLSTEAYVFLSINYNNYRYPVSRDVDSKVFDIFVNRFINKEMINLHLRILQFVINVMKKYLRDYPENIQKLSSILDSILNDLDTQSFINQKLNNVLKSDKNEN